jgi:L-threonylcarbamoyladenylate synthase
VTAGLKTVAVRMPEGLARDLVRLAGVPIAAPSANISGRPSPTTAAHVADDFPDVYVLDGGPTAHGLESTVVALEPHPVVLRQGVLSEELLRKVIPELKAPPARTKKKGAAVSPGTKYTHYAPSRPLILFLRRSSLLSYSKAHPKALVLSLGSSPEEIAKNLFAALRTRRRGTELLALAIPRRGIGRAVMDRLTRAATRIVP